MAAPILNTSCNIGYPYIQNPIHRAAMTRLTGLLLWILLFFWYLFQNSATGVMKIRGWAVNNRKFKGLGGTDLGVFAYVDVGGK